MKNAVDQTVYAPLKCIRLGHTEEAEELPSLPSRILNFYRITFEASV